MTPERALTDYPRYWAHRFGRSAFLPMSRAEMDALGWDECDIIVVSGDAYVDQATFGAAIIGRLLEAQGYRVGIIAQPRWQSVDDFQALGKPKLFFGVTAGNMDSMINRYTADRKVRTDDAYTPHGAPDKRPDRAVLVYAQRCKEAFPDSPVVLGGIEASLRRIAHYDYWSDKVRRSILVDAQADLLMYGNAERALVEVAHRLAKGQDISQIRDVRGTAYLQAADAALPPGWNEIDAASIDVKPDDFNPRANPYLGTDAATCADEKGLLDETPSLAVSGSPIKVASSPMAEQIKPLRFMGMRYKADANHAQTVIRLPSYEAVRADPVLYAHASRVLHQETNPGNARALVQTHGRQAVWINPPPIPLSTAEMDYVFDQPFARAPHPLYGDAPIPAWEMIRHSVNIMRGCFGGCTFCSITEHEGRIIQSRSEESVLREIEAIRDTVPSFTGIISDLGGPTANMYHLTCKDEKTEASCRRPSCVYPKICGNLNTNHSRLIDLYRRARALRGVKKILIGSGVRYDLAIESPEYIKELAQHHVGGYLKIAPEHSEDGPLSKMMKPGMGTYDRFKTLFDRYSLAAGKEQYLIPYFIAAHPGTTDEDMLSLALWLKQNGFRPDQVQAFYPSPMATATAMYHSGKNPLRKVSRDSEAVPIVRGERQRRLHKAFLKYHDAQNWPLLREALTRMGRSELIGNGKKHLVPSYQPKGVENGQKDTKAKTLTRRGAELSKASYAKQARKGTALTQHTGLPPRVTQ
jgi:uncharacterized radical SAM protein YgiQ